MSLPSMLRGLGLFAGCLGVLVLGIVVAVHVDTPFGLGTTRGSMWFRTSAVLGVTFATALLLVLLFAIAAEDRRHRVAYSPLFVAMVAAQLAVFAVLWFSSIGAADRALHDMRLTWTWTADPEVQTLAALSFIGIGAAFGWQTWVLVRGRRAG